MEEKINKQINYIMLKWFIITDELKVRWYLEKVWLHRLKRYFNTVEKYKWTDFQKIIDAYIFDKQLRILNIQIIEIIEKSIKNIFILSFDNINDETIYLNTLPQFKRWKENKKITKRLCYNEKKIVDMKYSDLEIKKDINDNWTISTSLFIDNLTFWEIINIFIDLNIVNQKKISAYYWLPLEIFINWLKIIGYLRNLCSHSRNIYNKKMTLKLKSKIITDLIGKNNSNSYIWYMMILVFFSKKLSPEFKWEEKVIKNMDYFKIDIKNFFRQKETSHIEHELWNSEAWKVLVNIVYLKYTEKSNN